jgi:hypothetical protein
MDTDKRGLEQNKSAQSKKCFFISVFIRVNPRLVLFPIFQNPHRRVAAAGAHNAAAGVDADKRGLEQNKSAQLKKCFFISVFIRVNPRLVLFPIFQNLHRRIAAAGAHNAAAGVGTDKRGLEQNKSAQSKKCFFISVFIRVNPRLFLFPILQDLHRRIPATGAHDAAAGMGRRSAHVKIPNW